MGPMNTLFDIGANLTHTSFQRDLDAVLDRAKTAHVQGLVVTGTELHQSQEALALAKQHPALLWSTAGIHPHHAKDYSDTVDAGLRTLLQDNVVVAVGECGLDYNRDFSPRDQQRSAFERQLQIAADTKKPLFLHERDAHDDFFAILKNTRDRVSDVVVHCFTGERAALHAYLDLGCSIGITGWVCDEKRGHTLRSLVGDIPADRLLIETDAPYLLPHGVRPKPTPDQRRNEPMYLRNVADTVAAIRGVDVDTLAKQTTDNARRFFRL